MSLWNKRKCLIGEPREEPCHFMRKSGVDVCEGCAGEVTGGRV